MPRNKSDGNNVYFVYIEAPPYGHGTIGYVMNGHRVPYDWEKDEQRYVDSLPAYVVVWDVVTAKNLEEAKNLLLRKVTRGFCEYERATVEGTKMQRAS